ncbi:hypothetical protein [Rhodoferax sp.]|nr:hypothetical protein [Rhodoferax sp.]
MQATGCPCFPVCHVDTGLTDAFANEGASLMDASAAPQLGLRVRFQRKF